MPVVPVLDPPAWWAVLLLVLSAAVPVALATRPLLTSLPEPDEPAGKPAYAELATRSFVAACAVLAALGASIVGLTVPIDVWPLWWVLCAPSVVLVVVDARTTWMPLRLTRLCWAATVGAALVTSTLSGWSILLRLLIGAAAAGLTFLLFYRLSGRRIGFGDVRLAPVLGAAGAAISWPTLFVVVFAGTVVGALVGLAGVLGRRRDGPYAYAPSMLAGAFAACLWQALSG